MKLNRNKIKEEFNHKIGDIISDNPEFTERLNQDFIFDLLFDIIEEMN